MNEEHKVENMGTDHYTSIVHLLRIVPEFRRFCEEYEVQPVTMYFIVEKSRWAHYWGTEN